MSPSVVDRFYTSLANRDGEAMAACYHNDVVFEDPAFGVLHGSDAGDMWRMLCSNATDLRVRHRIVGSTATTVRAQWIADYSFPATGNAVHNVIDATMTFRDGTIIDHRDEFDMWAWCSQALGLTGRLLGWSPPLRTKVRSTARGSLARFQAAQG